MANANQITDEQIIDLLHSAVRTDLGDGTLAGMRANQVESTTKDGVLYFTDHGDFYSVPLDLERLRAGIAALTSRG